MLNLFAVCHLTINPKCVWHPYGPESSSLWNHMSKLHCSHVSEWVSEWVVSWRYFSAVHGVYDRDYTDHRIYRTCCVVSCVGRRVDRTLHGFPDETEQRETGRSTFAGNSAALLLGLPPGCRRCSLRSSLFNLLHLRGLSYWQIIRRIRFVQDCLRRWLLIF